MGSSSADLRCAFWTAGRSATRTKERCDVRKLNYRGLWGAAAGLVLLATPVLAEDKPATDPAQAVKVTPMLTTPVTSSGQPIVMPQNDVQITVSTYEIPGGAKLPEHKHPYPRYGFMESGTLRVTNIDMNKTETYGPGSFILEAVDQWHKAENAGSDPVKLLVIDVMPKGATSTILRTN
jgi:quercetin dioxygenase-like cupin family protein